MKRPIFDKPWRRRSDETPCEWLIEPLRSHELFSVRRTFGCWSFYLGEKNVLLYVPANEPDDVEGILIATSHEHQPSLIAEFPQLVQNNLLKKWLCISADDEAFEDVSRKIVSLILANDPRIGVPGHTRARKLRKKKSLKRKNPSKK